MDLVSHQEITMPATAERTQKVGFADGDERLLITRIADNQDIRALEQLYQLYAPRLSKFLQRLTSDPGTIEEVCNDVMMAVWKQAKQFNGKSKVSTWIFSISYRICIKILKKSSWRPEDNGETFEKLSTTWIDESFSSSNDDNRQVINMALNQLSPKHRMVVELSYFSDLSYEEIAVIANCPTNTVKTRMFHARRQLKDIINDLSGEN